MTKDDIVALYKAIGIIKTTARMLHLSEYKVRRVLIDARELTTPKSTYISAQIAAGKSVRQIADEMQCTVSGVDGHMPYRRHPYGLGEQTENAKRIANWRKNKNTLKENDKE